MEKIPVRGIRTTPKESDFTRHFNIRQLQTMFHGNDKVEELHRHDHFFVLALEKGSGHHAIDFTPYRLSNHSIFIVRPGQVHELEIKSKSTGYLLKFKTGFYPVQDKSFDLLLRIVSRMNHYPMTGGSFKQALATLTRIFLEYTERQEGYEEVIKSNLTILFVELMRQHKTSAAHRKTYGQERLEKLQDLLEKHIANHKRVGQYADMLHLSPYQLNAVTKSALGKTCSDLINEQIILESKRHLLATSAQISHIAHDLGYEDNSYFIRFFKRHTGYSPEAFRQKFK